MWHTNIERQQSRPSEKKINVNFTINKNLYEQFKQVAEKRLQPKSWVIENMMKSYILETNK